MVAGGAVGTGCPPYWGVIPSPAGVPGVQWPASIASPGATSAASQLLVARPWAMPGATAVARWAAAVTPMAESTTEVSTTSMPAASERDWGQAREIGVRS